jgi:hypothetical protein
MSNKNFAPKMDYETKVEGDPSLFRIPEMSRERKQATGAAVLKAIKTFNLNISRPEAEAEILANQRDTAIDHPAWAA